MQLNYGMFSTQPTAHDNEKHFLLIQSDMNPRHIEPHMTDAPVCSSHCAFGENN